MKQKLKNRKKKILIKIFDKDNDLKLFSTTFDNTKFIKRDNDKFWS